MNYKELIEELRFLSLHVPDEMCEDKGKNTLEKAADVIEELSEEVKNLKEVCHRRYRRAKTESEIICFTCVHYYEELDVCRMFNQKNPRTDEKWKCGSYLNIEANCKTCYYYYPEKCGCLQYHQESTPKELNFIGCRDWKKRDDK